MVAYTGNEYNSTTASSGTSGAFRTTTTCGHCRNRVIVIYPREPHTAYSNWLGLDPPEVALSRALASRFAPLPAPLRATRAARPASLRGSRSDQRWSQAMRAFQRPGFRAPPTPPRQSL